MNQATFPWKGAIALLAASAFCAPPARAMDNPKPVEVGGFVGYHFFSDTNKLGRSHDDPIDNALNDSPVVGLRAGYNLIPYLALEAELAMVPTGVRGPQNPVAPTANPAGGMGAMIASSEPYRASVLAFSIRAHAILHLSDGPVRPFLLAGGGFMTSATSNSAVLAQDTDAMFHFGAGVKAAIGDNWGLRAEVRMYLPPDTQYRLVTEDYEVLLGLYGRFGGASKPVEPPKPIDTDGDGIPDNLDKCPAEKGPAENNGCPDKDTDGDGMVDRLDNCPTQAGPKENQGCPDTDVDKDGTVDRLDKCVSVPGPADNEGCPLPDADGDGVPDRDDKCPQVAGPKENGGCPDVDTDKDGVIDRLDQCPTVAGPAENDGCPIPEKLKAFTGVIQGINFKTGSAQILPTSFKLLDKSVTVLNEFPDEKLEISGHTDTVGERQKNIELSKARAESVKTYLEKKGVKEGRLVAVGYGPDKPIADNKTAKGKAKNRRVEFHLVPQNKPEPTKPEGSKGTPQGADPSSATPAQPQK